MNYSVLLKKLQADSKLRNIPQFLDIHQEYFCISETLKASSKATFSLDVLRVLCRNLEQEWWHNAVDGEGMILLALDCADAVQDAASQSDLPKLLACLYHIHNYAVKKKAKENLVFNISTNILSIDSANMLCQYCKTYWAVYVDKLAYIEWQKVSKINISQHLIPITEELCKIMQIYNLNNFCKDNLVPVIKKLFYIYNDKPIELNSTFINIFKSLLSHKEISDVKSRLKLERDVSHGLFENVNSVLGVIVQNSSNCSFSNCALPYAVRFAKKYFSHRPDFLHTIMSIYSEAFCYILVEKTKLTPSLKTFLNDFLMSIETSIDLGYTEALKDIFPYLNSMIRFHVEYCVRSLTKIEWKSIFTDDVLSLYLRIILSLLKELPSCKQVMKCDNCKLQNGAHDAMRLSFLPRLFTVTSLKYEMCLEKVLPLLFDILEEQKAIKKSLTRMQCVNIAKCYLKMQTDMHNDAILLYKNGYLKFSLKLFDMYIGNEMETVTGGMEVGALSRSFYNKAICALDMELHETALISAYVSMLLGGESVYEIKKHIIMVIDVKSRALKSGKESELGADVRLQMMNVFDGARHVVDSEMFAGIEVLFGNAEFSRLLLHEVELYAELWPATMPSAGVCRAYLQYLEPSVQPWIMCEDETTKLLNGVRIVLSVACSVRSLSCEHFEALVTRLIEKLSTLQPPTAHTDLALASCLLLQSSLRSSELRACQQNTTDVDGEANQAGQLPPSFTEVAGVEGPARVAVNSLGKIMENLRSTSDLAGIAPIRCALAKCLCVAECVLQTLLYQQALETGLQLAIVCADMALVLENEVSYLRSVGVLLEHARSYGPALAVLVRRSGEVAGRMLRDDDSVDETQASDEVLERADVALHYVLDAALFHLRTGDRGLAVRLVNMVQQRILSMYTDPGDATPSNGKRSVDSLQTTCARLAELQTALGVASDRVPMRLTLLAAAQRQYVAWKRYGGTSSSWAVRSRLSEWCVRGAARVCSAARCGAARALLARRARAAAAAALRAGASSVSLWMAEQLALGRLAARCGKADEAKVKINAVRCMLEADPVDRGHFGNYSNPEQLVVIKQEEKEQKRDADFTMATPMEIVLDSSAARKPQMLFRSGSPCFHFVDAFRAPLFFNHPVECACEPCNSIHYILAYVELARLEALMYFMSGESRMAENFYDGCGEIIELSKIKVNNLLCRLDSLGYSDVVSEIVKGIYENDILMLEFNLCMDLGCFSISEDRLDDAYTYTKKAFDLKFQMEDDPGALEETVLHQLCTIKYLQTSKLEINIEPLNEDDACLKIQKELEKLQLSPTPKYESKYSPRTPEMKLKVPPKVEKKKIVVKDEDLPHNPKRVVIKLNLPSDGESPKDEESEIPKQNKFFKCKKADQSGNEDFKIPVPKIDIPVLEFNTPKRSTRKTRTAGNVAAFKKSAVSRKAASKNDSELKECSSDGFSFGFIPKTEVLDSVPTSDATTGTYITPSGKKTEKVSAKIPRRNLLNEAKNVDTISEDIFLTPSCSFIPVKKPIISRKVTKIVPKYPAKEDSFESSSEVFLTPSATKTVNEKKVLKNSRTVPKKLLISSSNDDSVDLNESVTGSELFVTPSSSIRTYSRSTKVAGMPSSPDEVEQCPEGVTPKLQVSRTTRARVLRANRVKLSPDVDLREKITLTRRKK